MTSNGPFSTNPVKGRSPGTFLGVKNGASRVNLFYCAYYKSHSILSTDTLSANAGRSLKTRVLNDFEYRGSAGLGF